MYMHVQVPSGNILYRAVFTFMTISSSYKLLCVTLNKHCTNTRLESIKCCPEIHVDAAANYIVLLHADTAKARTP